MSPVKTVLATLAGLTAAAGIIVGGWQVGWWFTAANNTRQAEITQNGYANQVTLRQEITRQIASVQTIGVQLAKANGDQSLIAALKPQAMSIAGIVCQAADEISGTPLPADQAGWVSANCANGSVSPSSVYYVAGE